MPDARDIDALEGALSTLVDDVDFHQLDARLGQFNLFEAMGGVRAELRHSNFLAFLLSPSRAHGLGAGVLEAMLRAILAQMPPSQRPIRTLELVVADLDEAIVHRERDNIDLLIEFTGLKLIVLIENKVGAGAGEGQLARYKALVERRYPDYRRLLVFLTPAGDDPQCDGYAAFSYQSLAGVLDELAGKPSTPDTLGLILTHYVEMLRRHVVPDEDLKALARRLYDKHREAFDFVFEARPERQGLLDVVKINALGVGLEEDTSGTTLFRFYAKPWDGLDILKCDQGLWSKSGRGVLFEAWVNDKGGVHLALILGPCPSEVRERFLAVASKRAIFASRSKRTGQKTSRLYHRELLSPALVRTHDFDQQRNLVGLAWSDFQGRDLMALIGEVEAIGREIGAD